MRNTTKWGLTVPSDDTDEDDVPTHLGTLADQLDDLLGSQAGTLALRPATGKSGQLYYVDAGPGVGRLYRWEAGGWVLLNGVRAENVGAGVPVAITYGSSGSAGTAASGYAAANHEHPAPPNPVTAHIAAANPHPQYVRIADIDKYVSGYRGMFLAMGA